MPDHIDDYRGIEIYRRQNSKPVEGGIVATEDYYGIASGRILASDSSIEELKRKIDQLLDPPKR